MMSPQYRTEAALQKRLCGVLIVAVLWTLARSSWAAEAVVTEHWYPATLDHQRTGLSMLVVEQGERRFVRLLDLAQLGIEAPSPPDRRHAGEWYVDTSRIGAYAFHIDPLAPAIHLVGAESDHLKPPASEYLLLDVIINGRAVDQPVLLRYAHGDIRVDEAALEALGLDAQKLSQVSASDAIGLHDLAGELFAYDPTQLQLTVTVPPDLLEETGLAVHSQPRTGEHPQGEYSAIIGYDLNAGIDDAGEDWQAALVELAGSNGPGSCVHRHAWRSQRLGAARRLDSYCRWDWPGHLLSATLGDEVSAISVMGQPVRYAGIRIGTDFGLAPRLLTQPTIAIEGSARVPSTLELWVDQMLMLRSDLPPGPFNLSDIPLHTGAGTVQAVVTDMLGNRQVISRSFYSDPVLLAPGLADWSAELGRTRIGFGTVDDRYAEDFALLVGRRGLTDWLTLGGRAELLEAGHMLALAANVRIGDLGILELGVLGSEHDGNRGQAGLLGFSRRGQRWSGGFRHMITDADFIQLGYDLPGSAPAATTEASVGVAFPGGVSLNIGAQARELRDGEDRALLSAALNFPLGRYGALTVSAFEPIEPEGDTMLSVFATMPWGDQHTASASLSSDGDSLDAGMTLQSNVPAGPGSGYRLSAAQRSGTTAARGEYITQGSRSRLGIRAEYLDGALAAQLRSTGAVVMTPSGLSLSRLETGSFGLVQLPAAGVRVYHDERLATITDASGQAVIPGLRPYQRNRLRVALEDLPLESRIHAAELELIPGRRQALTARFEIEATRFVTAHLVLSDGQAVPAGAAVTLGEPREGSVVGHGGLIFLPIADQRRLSIRVHWPQDACHSDLQIPQAAGAVIELGTVTCKSELLP